MTRKRIPTLLNSNLTNPSRYRNPHTQISSPSLSFYSMVMCSLPSRSPLLFYRKRTFFHSDKFMRSAFPIFAIWRLPTCCGCWRVFQIAYSWILIVRWRVTKYKPWYQRSRFNYERTSVPVWICSLLCETLCYLQVTGLLYFPVYIRLLLYPILYWKYIHDTNLSNRSPIIVMTNYLTNIPACIS